MSDKEGSPRVSRSRSRASDNDSHKSGKGSKSRSRSRSKASHRSRSRSDSRHRRSRTRSRSRRSHRSHSRGRKYRSRSRSPYYSSSRKRRYSRSRSRSRGGRRRYSPEERHHGGGRYRSRSPMSRRKRHVGTREAPTSSRCLGVFGLSLYTQERELKDFFNRYGPVEQLNIVYDHHTGRSRGFAFLTMRHLSDAEEAKERAPGTEIEGHKIRVDYSITERAHTPTPGIYLGKPTGGRYTNGASRRGSDYNSRRSPSPYHRRSSRYSRSRSRSRSYSPRRY